MNQRIVILGGGFAALEAAFYLRWRLGPHADLLLIADQDSFAFRPNLVHVPFGADPMPLHIPLEPATRAAGVRMFVERVRDVDFPACMVLTEDGPVAYDRLIIATGARARPDLLPGLVDFGYTLDTASDMLRLRQALRRITARASEGRAQRILFLVPDGQVSAGPLVEVALRTDAWLQRQGVRDRVHLSWSTPERHYLEAFGPQLDAEVERAFAGAGILGHRGESPVAVRSSTVDYASGLQLPHDLVVASSPLASSVRYTGAPKDNEGFLRVRPRTRQVLGLDDVYAVGDASSNPVKQAILACLQADVAAEDLAARVLGTSPEFTYDPASPWVLAQYDRAAFAMVPLRDADADAATPLRGVEASRGWRFVRKMLGLYVPWRFRHGRPVHAGMVWRSLQFSLKAVTASLSPATAPEAPETPEPPIAPTREQEARRP